MISDSAETDALIGAVGPETPVAEAFRLLALASLPGGMTRKMTATRLIENQLRFERDGHWLYTAVLNAGWVLFYFRRPAFREAGLDPHALKAQFPAIKVGTRDELKLRIHDRATAEAVLALIA